MGFFRPNQECAGAEHVCEHAEVHALSHSEEAFENVLHAPSGINAHQGDLIRCEGRWEPTGCVHDFGFRRFTSQKLEALDRNNEKFMITRGCKGPFIEMGSGKPPQS